MVLQSRRSSTQAVTSDLPVEQGAEANREGDRASWTYPSAEIPRISVHHVTPEFFQSHYRKPGLPVIVTGLLEAEHPRWTLDFLEHNLGDLVFPIRFYGQERYTQDKRTWSSIGSGVETRPLSFSDYAAMLRNGQASREDAYLGRCSLTKTPLHELPLLRAAEAQLGLKSAVTGFSLWLGSSGHTSCLHYDSMDGTLVQLHGQKHALLFPPHQTYNLYPVPLLKQLRHGLTLRAAYSQVYPHSPDFKAFPKFQEALVHAQTAILNPGDILFLPTGWWHELTSLHGSEMVCSINRFWTIRPFYRGLTSWNKWRVHMGSLCAAPHGVGEWVGAIAHSDDRRTTLRTLLQKL